MADIFAAAATWLAAMQQQHASQSVVYRAGEVGTEVTATIGRTEWQEESSEGVYRKWESRDFFVAVGALAAEPKRGDRIEETLGTTRFVYQVLAPGSEPVFRYADAYRNRWRIHTKLLKTEPLP